MRVPPLTLRPTRSGTVVPSPARIQPTMPTSTTAGRAHRAQREIDELRQVAEIGAIPSPDEAQVQERVAAYIVDELGEERAAERRAVGAAATLDELLEDVASGP
jgi:hypothetical protein